VPVQAGAAQNRGAGPLEKVRLQLEWYHQFLFAGYYMAKELGYYRDEGLDVEFAEAKTSMNYADEVLSGRADYGIDSTDLLVERARGKKIVVLAAVFQHSPEVLVSLPKSGIASPKDLAGRSVMLSTEAVSDIQAMLQSESISPDSVRFVPHTGNLDDLLEGRVDAIAAYSTDVPIRLAERGIACSIMRPITYGIDFYGDCLFTSERELRSNPRRGAAFLRASLKGWEYAMDHVEESINVILARYPTNLTRDELELEAKAMDEIVVHKLVPVGFMNPGRWRHIGDTYAKLGLIPANYDLGGFLYAPNSAMDSRIIWGGIISLSVCIVIALTYILALRTFNAKLAAEVRVRTNRLEILNAELADEVAERREKERELATSLAEKEVLLREIHHRVKNNLQIITSLVNLQIGDAPYAETLAPLENIRDRVYSMSLVHEHLYEGANLSLIDMESYLRTLVNQISETYARPGLSLSASTKAEGLYMVIEHAIPLGLLTVELLANSMKYAYSGRDRGRLETRLEIEEGDCVLVVADDGPEYDIESSRPGGIGLKLVEALASQLKGRMHRSTGAGCTTRVVFPASLVRRMELAGDLSS
jgi:two-component sensor histidine kinase/ABC-type nitrate/sulfonate/bicarbonate transport system substrate-binding protein